MSETFSRDLRQHSQDAASASAERPFWPALRRGLTKRCPSCGEGALYRAFLKPHDRCGVCGQDLSGHRADDLPPYATILIVGHLLIPALVALERVAPPPLWMAALLWSSAAIVLCLLLLPPVKGAVIALQWAFRMHGFHDPGDAKPSAPDRVADPLADRG